jgi:hypothetical protein
MTVTEFAILRILPSHDQGNVNPPPGIISPTLLSHLKAAASSMSSFSGGLPFTFYQSLTDPALIFLIGGWQSARSHWEEWIPSQQNQELLELLKGMVEVVEMWHIDVPRERVERVEGWGGEGVVSVEKWKGKVKARERVGGEMGFEEVKDMVQKGVGRDAQVESVGGWRMEKGFAKGEDVVMEEMGQGDGGGEWVLFTGCESQEEYAMSVGVESVIGSGGLELRMGEEGEEVVCGVRIDLQSQQA